MELNIVFLDAGTLYGSSELRALEKLGKVTLFHNTVPNEIATRIETAHVIITNKVQIHAEHMQAAKHLKMICVAATGMNNIDLDAAAQYHIPVHNVVDYSSFSVAQTTLAMVMYLRMQLHVYNQFVQSGSYTQHPFFTHLDPLFQDLNGQTWGIIGLGNIGKTVAGVARSLGMHIQAHSVSGNSQPGDITFLDLNTLLSTSDVVSIHVPLRENTKHLLQAQHLAAMKPHAVLINVARGGIVDEKALAQAIDQDFIAGAGVDVFSQEPIRLDNPLLFVQKKHKLVLSPHIAWGSENARKNLVQGIVRNIEILL